MKSKDNEKRYISSLGEGKDLKSSSFGMIAFALVLGFIVGFIVWLLFLCSTKLTGLVWSNVYLALPYSWAPLVVCPIGGLIIGLFIKYSGVQLDSLEEVMAKMQEKGSYKLEKPLYSAVLFLLPIIFGGSIGPEAGLTGIIVSACTKASESLKKMGMRVVRLPEITVSATLSAIFATPFIGMVSEQLNEQNDNDEYVNLKEYTFKRNAKLVLYTSAAIGSLGAVLVLKSVLVGSQGLPHFDGIDPSMIELGLVVPCLVLGYVGALLFFFFDYKFSELSKYFDNRPIVKPVIAGIALGIIATMLPLVLFSGEPNIHMVMVTWQGIAGIALVLTGLLKCVLTPLCTNFSWKGGHFFPCIFAGVSLGYGVASLFGANPMFCIAITTGCLIAAIQRKPLVAIALLLLCFPIRSIIWIGLACLIGSALPIPEKILNH